MKVRTSSASAKGARISAEHVAVERAHARLSRIVPACHERPLIRLALLWHMHQPYYLDPATGESHPAVGAAARPQGLLGHGGAARASSRACAPPSTSCRRSSSRSRRSPHERTWDRHLVLGLKPTPTRSTPPTRAWFVREGFHAHAPTMIEPYPRYAELRGARARAAGAFDGRRPARSAGLAEAGLGRSRRAGDRRARAAAGGEGARLRRGRQGGAARRRARAAAPGGAGLPRGRGRAGDVELSTSPYFHPILPLLCDSAAHHRARTRRRRCREPPFRASRGRRAAARARDRRAPRAGSACRPPGSGRRRAACRTRRRPRWREPGSAGWPATRTILARSPSPAPLDAPAPLPARTRCATAGRGSPRAVPRPRAVGPDRVHLSELGAPRPRRPTSSRRVREAGRRRRRGTASPTRWCR